MNTGCCLASWLCRCQPTPGWICPINSQPRPRHLLFPLPHSTDYRCTQPFLAFDVLARDQNAALHSFTAVSFVFPSYWEFRTFCDEQNLSGMSMCFVVCTVLYYLKSKIIVDMQPNLYAWEMFNTGSHQTEFEWNWEIWKSTSNMCSESIVAFLWRS